MVTSHGSPCFIIDDTPLNIEASYMYLLPQFKPDQEQIAWSNKTTFLKLALVK